MIKFIHILFCIHKFRYVEYPFNYTMVSTCTKCGKIKRKYIIRTN